ncbi:TPA: hypothetical protein H1012_03165 [archaeon]|nr:hypothetical protein [Candidatus Naiadarchaeales archaeon SRR2090153.bin461]HIK02817.1 hypothetical protein [Candidatus Naiadarchaeales archaeon SRR2090159.bin1288]
MKIKVTNHSLHRFVERILKKEMNHGEFAHKFAADADFRKKVIEEFEKFFFQNLEDATIYKRSDDSLWIMGGSRIVLAEPLSSERKDFDLLLKTIDFTWLELSNGRMGREMKKGPFLRGRLTFLYPTDEKKD